jgi:hypothetical protein
MSRRSLTDWLRAPLGAASLMPGMNRYTAAGMMLGLVVCGTMFGPGTINMMTAPTYPDDKIIGFDLDTFTLHLHNGQTVPLPPHLQDDLDRLGNPCYMKWALLTAGVFNYTDMMYVDNLTWDRGWIGDDWC